MRPLALHVPISGHVASALSSIALGRLHDCFGVCVEDLIWTRCERLCELPYIGGTIN